MAKFRKKPVVIEAVQIGCVDHNGKTPDGSPFMECPIWLAKAVNAGIVRDKFIPSSDFCHIEIKTLSGMVLSEPGDWIMRGVNGEIYPCKPDIFEKTYEPVEG